MFLPAAMIADAFMLPVTMRTACVAIRELEGADADAVQRSAGDPEVVRHLPFGPNTSDETRAFLDRVLMAQHERPRRDYELGMCQGGELIGCVRISERPYGRVAGGSEAPGKWRDTYVYSIVEDEWRSGENEVRSAAVRGDCKKKVMGSDPTPYARRAAEVIAARAAPSRCPVTRPHSAR